MDGRIKDLTAFLDSACSPYHAVAYLTGVLEQAGYLRLQEQERWELAPGGKYYLTHGGSSLVAFRIPEQTPSGFMLSISHCDRPGFLVKENLERTGKYTRLDTEGYGGMVMYSWLDRPLSIAGQVMVQTGQVICRKLVNIDRDLMLIPSVAIHFNRTVNDGVALNPAVDTLPLIGGEDTAGKLQQLLEDQAGGKLLGHDLYVYLRQGATLWGLEEEYISAPGLDDLTCVWGCTQGFLEAAPSDVLPVLWVVDNEEVGSASYRGADSPFMQDVLKRICEARDLEMSRMLPSSFMVSADNAQALNPNHPELSDAANAPVLNGGVALKFTAQRKYTTDGYSAAVFRSICQKAGVPLQDYYNRADMPGGSTVGSLVQTQIAVPGVDIGLPQLAMHTSFETVGVKDVLYLAEAMTAFYSTAICHGEADEYILR